MRHALTIPPYGELADPAALMELAVSAENSGWDAVFLWDHVLRRPDDPQETADPWVAMAAMAVATERVRLGPMVTPITRRRPIKLARECTTLDHLSVNEATGSTKVSSCCVRCGPARRSTSTALTSWPTR